MPGAEDNLPTGAAERAEQTATAAPAAGIVRETHTRNFELNHVQEKRVSSGSSIKRLTVAVVVDGAPSADPRVLVLRARPSSTSWRPSSAARSAPTKSAATSCGGVGALLGRRSERANRGARRRVRAPAQSRRIWPITVGGALALALLTAVVLTRKRRRAAVPSGPTRPLILSAAEMPLKLPEASTPAHRIPRRPSAAPGRSATAALVVRHWLGPRSRMLRKAA